MRLMIFLSYNGVPENLFWPKLKQLDIFVYDTYHRRYPGALSSTSSRGERRGSSRRASSYNLFAGVGALLVVFVSPISNAKICAAFAGEHSGDGLRF
jgi:hypothetical protein